MSDIQMVHADNSMCGHIRIIWPATQLMSAGNPDILLSRKVHLGIPSSHLMVQRCLERRLFDLTKDNPAKLIIELDDMLMKLYGEELPSYNICRTRIDLNSTTESLKYGLEFTDKVVVSTEFLKQAIIDNYNYDKVEVVPNMLPRCIYHSERKPLLEHDLEKARVVYAAGITHYDDKNPGDFSREIIQFIHDNIDKIELIIIGKLPWFLSDISSKIQVLPYVTVLQFPRLLKSLNSDFYLAPLRENVFNKCKSNLKYLEACAAGTVCIGSNFDNSPYSMLDDMCKIEKTMTSKNISDMFWNLCKKENWNKVLTKQYEYMNSCGWLENQLWRYENIFKENTVRV